MLKTFSGKLSLIVIFLLVIALIGGGIYLKGRNTSVNVQISNASPTPIPSTTPEAMASANPTTTTGQNPKPSVKPTPSPTPSNVFEFGFNKGPYTTYKITLQPGWRAIPSTNNNDTRMNLIIDKYLKDGSYYSMTISEDLSFNPGKCTFPGETPGPNDRALVSFAEINAGPVTFRRGPLAAGQKTQLVCQKQITGYAQPTQFGNWLINLYPDNINTDTVIEIDKMLSSVRATQ